MLLLEIREQAGETITLEELVAHVEILFQEGFHGKLRWEAGEPRQAPLPSIASVVNEPNFVKAPGQAGVKR